MTCHVIEYHSIARNRARYNQLLSKSNRNFDQQPLMDVSNNRSSSHIHHLDNRLQHPITWNRACYNKKRIGWHNESDSSRGSINHDKSTTTSMAYATNIVEVDDACTQLRNPPPFEELSHTTHDKHNMESEKAETLGSSGDYDKENVDQTSIKRYNNDIAKVSIATKEKMTTSRALQPMNHFFDSNGSREAENLVIVSKPSDKISTSLHIEDACEDVVAKDGHATFCFVNDPSPCNRISKDNMHPQLSNDSELAPNEEITQMLPSSTSHLTVLISSGVYEYIQASRQRDALSLLNDLGMSYVTVDGMDQLQKEKRDELFKISGIRGNYPQIFVTAEVGVGETHRFLGGYDWLRSTNIEELGAIVGTTFQSDGMITKGEAASGNSNSPDSVIVSSTIKPTNTHRLILLISKGVYDNVQASNQEYAMTWLSEACIPYTIVDGMDPLQRDERNALFAISGIRGNYPQIFALDGNRAQKYLGGNDWLRTIEIEDLKSLLSR